MTGEENKRKWRIGPSKDEKCTLKSIQISAFLNSILTPFIGFFSSPNTRPLNVHQKITKTKMFLQSPPESVGVNFENRDSPLSRFEDALI